MKNLDPYATRKVLNELLDALSDEHFRESIIDIVTQAYVDYTSSLEEYIPANVWEDCTGRKFRVHEEEWDCAIYGCAIHSPTNHPLVDAKQLMRVDKNYLIERICTHGIGHPDPDSANFLEKSGYSKAIWVHGCDGCCQDTMVESTTTPGKPPSGWGPHVHEFVWFDDDNGHSGSFCRCGQEEC